MSLFFHLLTNDCFQGDFLNKLYIYSTLSNISLPFHEVYLIEGGPPGGTFIYIRNHLSYKTRNDLKIYKSFELESTFIEIFNTKKTYIIIGCIYKHPSMNINEFNDDYLNELLDKLSKENKTIFLLGDCNINLLNYDIHPPTNEFLDSLSSHNFVPHILQPSRVTANSKTFIDNIFPTWLYPI